MSGLLQTARRWAASSEVSYSSTSTSYADAATVTIDVRRGGVIWALLPIACTGQGELSATYNSGAITNFGVWAKVTRDGTTVFENLRRLGIIATAGLKTSLNPTAYFGFDPCAPGSHTYVLQLKSPSSNFTIGATGFKLFVAEAR